MKNRADLARIRPFLQSQISRIMKKIRQPFDSIVEGLVDIRLLQNRLKKERLKIQPSQEPGLIDRDKKSNVFVITITDLSKSKFYKIRNELFRLDNNGYLKSNLLFRNMSNFLYQARTEMS